MERRRRRLERGPRTAATGPLTVHPDNRRYFCTPDGRAVYLTGSHTWGNVQERRYPETPSFNCSAYLDWLVALNHNCTRLWAWEHATWMQFTQRRVEYVPNRYARTGPDLALDGLPRFDVTRFDEHYMDRLVQRVRLAGERGIYVLVMLFQGFSIDQKIAGPLDRSVGDPWRGHPFHRDNNINGIDGDPEGTGRGRLVHTLALPRVLALQERFVRRVVRMLNNQDNVIWEISNESPATSMRWQYHMASFVKDLEEQLPKQHPVLVTVPWGPAGAGENDELFASPADAISPNPKGGYKDAPPPADGSKIVINDTDHLWGIGGTADWVWQAFLAGQHPIFMDPYLDVRTGEIYDAQWESVRRAMGHTLCYAQRLKMAEMAPADRMVDAGRCLACPGTTYLIWLPLGKTEVSLDLTGAEGPFSVEWFRPDTEELFDGREVMGGASVRLKRPDAAYRIVLVRSVEWGE